MLGGALAVLQAPMFDGLSLDPFSLFDDVAGPAEVGVSGRHVLQALVVTPVIVVFDERLDLGFEVTGQEVVFQQDAVLHGLVPALDLALRLGMERRTAHMDHTLGFDVFSQLAGDVAGSIVRQQARSVMHVGRRTARGNQRKIQRFGAALEVAVIPAAEGPARDAQLLQRLARWQVGLLDDPDDLELLGSRIPHSRSPPSAIMLFLSRRFSSVRSATHSFRALASRRRSFTSSVVAARAVSPARRRLPASMNSFDQV